MSLEKIEVLQLRREIARVEALESAYKSVTKILEGDTPPKGGTLTELSKLIHALGGFAPDVIRH